jgi:hypothetical protein
MLRFGRVCDKRTPGPSAARFWSAFIEITDQINDVAEVYAPISISIPGHPRIGKGTALVQVFYQEIYIPNVNYPISRSISAHEVEENMPCWVVVRIRFIREHILSRDRQSPEER